MEALRNIFLVCRTSYHLQFVKKGNSPVYLYFINKCLFTTADESCGLEWHARYRIIKGICEGLKYIHELEEPICHLDLKPDNILLDKDMVPKIADFGLSRIFGNDELARITRNPYGTR